MGSGANEKIRNPDSDSQKDIFKESNIECKNQIKELKDDGDAFDMAMECLASIDLSLLSPDTNQINISENTKK